MSKETALGKLGFTKIVTKKMVCQALQYFDHGRCCKKVYMSTGKHCNLSLGNAGALATHT